MSQTSYNEQGVAQIGMIADSSLRNVDSFIGEGAIPYGRFVVRGTDDEKQCKLPAAATDITDAKKNLGIALSTQEMEIPLNSTADPQYPDKRAISTMSFGRVWVETESATTDVDQDVYVRHAVAGALNKLGGFAAAAGTGLAKLENAKWRTADQTINGRTLAILELRL